MNALLEDGADAGARHKYMNNDLYELCKSDYEVLFTCSRVAFVNKWFKEKRNIPIWFEILYYRKPEMVVVCFNHRVLKLPFPFQD